jgi:pimeloyl-ACP methyl ester carboxylesterase
MNTVTSKDGTKIAYEKAGSGPAVILVDGVFGSRAAFGMNKLIPLLSEHFTAISYDRRGRNESNDMLPKDASPETRVQREVEDIEAVLSEAGGSAYMYGESSGAVLASYAAGSLKGIKKLALYEPPLASFGGTVPPAGYLDELQKLVAADKKNDAAKYFLSKVMGAPGFAVFIMQFMPFWKDMKVVGHTVIYDGAVMGDFTISPALGKALAAIKAPTLVMHGGKSFGWMGPAADAVAKHISGSTRRTLEGQTHEVTVEAITPPLIEFFSA